MTQALSKEDVNRRLVRLRNIERLYENQKKRIDVQGKLIRELQKENTLLRKINTDLTHTLEDFKLQIEELRTMVFGKKRRKETEDDDDILPPKEKVERSADSYKRPLPQEKDVTEVVPHPIDGCKHCHGTLRRKETSIFFEEDIPLPARKIVRKHIVEKGYCASCKKWSTSIPLPAHTVTLGNNVQKYICYLSVMSRMSYQQIQSIVKDAYRFEISQGEIAKILDREAMHHHLEYEHLKIRIRGEPGTGLDETGWKILSHGENSFAWVMTGIESKESVYLLGESRGGGNVKVLQGEDYGGFSVTDDYGGYKKLPKHQLCFAHLIRKFRDLAESKEFGKRRHAYYVRQYTTIAGIFSDLENDRREDMRSVYTKRLAELSIITSRDCAKMIRIKTALSKNISKYLTCLSDPLIPLTNNQSERSLRHLVLKRTVSFGSYCKRTAGNLAILLSILMSRRQRNPDGYFGEWVGV